VKSWLTSDLIEQVRGSGKPWLEFLRVADLSAGLYHLRAGADDRQEPHSEDELYVVMSGRAGFESDGERNEISTGSVLFVPAGRPHRFLDIREDLSLLVFFAPPEHSRASPADSSALPEK
jgi:mannose-6-phosphate isomerase-like protein (cupin superfamily)